MKTNDLRHDPIHLFGDFAECKSLIRDSMKDTENIKKQIWENSPGLKKFAEKIQARIGRKTALNWTELAMIGDEAIADKFSSPNHYFSDDVDTFEKLSFVYYANHLLKYYNQEFVRLYSSPILFDVG